MGQARGQEYLERRQTMVGWKVGRQVDRQIDRQVDRQNEKQSEGRDESKIERFGVDARLTYRHYLVR